MLSGARENPLRSAPRMPWICDAFNVVPAEEPVRIMGGFDETMESEEGDAGPAAGADDDNDDEEDDDGEEEEGWSWGLVLTSAAMVDCNGSLRYFPLAPLTAGVKEPEAPLMAPMR